MIVTMIGVMRSGAAYIPIDPGYPQERVQYMVSDSEAAQVVTTKSHANLLGSSAAKLLFIEDLLASPCDEHIPLPPITSTSLAYVIYTSGSTGKPKGVLLQHRGLVALCHSIRHSYRMTYNASKFLLFASSSFDASVLEIFVPIGNACTVVMLASNQLGLQGDQLAKAMAATGVTVAVLPPAMLATMSEECFPPKSLVTLVTAGEAVNDEVLARWRPLVRMLNAYGPTENTVASTVCDFDGENVVVFSAKESSANVTRLQALPKQAVPTRSPPIGRPIPNARCYVVDSKLQPVAPGIPGELVVSGPGVARGYHKNEEKTKSCFVPNPFDPERLPVMYRTGDLVRWLPNGLIEFMGRIDLQVKIRGFRIELGEVESVVMSFRDGKVIADCAVDVRSISTGKALVGYVVLKPQADEVPTVAQLKAHVRSQLPDYMVPATFVTLKRLPVTPSGKVDRKSLPQPFEGSEDPTKSLAAQSPQTPIQAALLVLIREVLGDVAVGIEDNFFDVGGHSLAAMQLVARIRENFGVEMLVAHIFEGPRVATIAENIELLRGGSSDEVQLVHRLEAGPGTEQDNTGVAVQSAIIPTERTFPLSFNQEALWFAYSSDVKSSALNVIFAARVASAVDTDALRRALTCLAVLHPCLRSQFGQDTSGTPMQQFRSVASISVLEHTWSQQECKNSALQSQRIEEDALAPFNLETGNVFRTNVYFGEGKSVTHLIFAAHHIITDLLSTELLISDLGIFYKKALEADSYVHKTAIADLSRADVPNVQALLGQLGQQRRASTVNYVDFTYWQRENIRGGLGDKLFAFWQRTLSGCPATTTVPATYSRPQIPSYRGGTHVVSIPSELTSRISNCAKQFSSTPAALWLSSVFAWVHRLTSQADLVIGMPMGGRTKMDLESVVGDFVNLVPIRVTVDADANAANHGKGPGAATFRSLVRQVKSTMIAALMNQEFPFGLTVQRLQQFRDISHSPIFQILFVHEKPNHAQADLGPFILGDEGGKLRLGSMDLESIALKEKRCQYDLVFAVSEGAAGRIDCRIQYATDLFSAATVARFADHWMNVLKSGLENPNAPLCSLSLMSTEERQQLVVERNLASTDEFPALQRRACMHTVFEEQVASLPKDTIALRDTEKTSWTYTQLNNVANLLAQHIRSVVPPTGEKVLVVLMPRSANYVMALVAAAKSGCAYCPIDVKVPKDRVQYIVKDSGASVLLTVREQRDLAASVIEPGVQVIFVDEFVEKIESVDAVVPNVPNVTNWMSPMYIIYTSGSTGRPKGVVVHHGAVVNTCSWFAKAHHVRVGDVSAQNLGAAFDPVTVEVWPYLISGANIIVMDENSKFGGAEATLAFIKKWAVTHITFPTALSTIIFDTAEFPPGLALRSWSCGGDKFKGTSRPLTFSVVNAYGPTECCVLCSQYPTELRSRRRTAHGSDASRGREDRDGTALGLPHCQHSSVCVGRGTEASVSGDRSGSCVSAARRLRSATKTTTPQRRKRLFPTPSLFTASMLT